MPTRRRGGPVGARNGRRPDDEPYSFNREFIYKWVTHSDGGWDLKRILPDPVFNCQGANIPSGAKTFC